MKTILVTGCAGFIGSHFVRSLHKCQHDILDQQMETPFSDWRLMGVDKFTYAADIKRLDGTELDGDLTTMSSIECLPDESFVNNHINLVINYAAETHVDNSIKDAGEFLESNIFGVYNLLDIIRRKSPHTKFLQISTDEVFGPRESDSPAKASCMEFNPQNPYAASKAAAEHLVRSFGNTYGLKYGIIRSGNVFGPYQHPEKMIPKTVRALIDGESVIVYGDGQHRRMWTNIADHTNEVLWWAGNLLGSGIFTVSHVGPSFTCTNLELVHRIAKILGVDSYEVEFVPDRMGHDREYCIEGSVVSGYSQYTPYLNSDIYNFERYISDITEEIANDDKNRSNTNS